jgi:hypothetical protein
MTQYTDTNKYLKAGIVYASNPADELVADLENIKILELKYSANNSANNSGEDMTIEINNSGQEISTGHLFSLVLTEDDGNRNKYCSNYYAYIPNSSYHNHETYLRDIGFFDNFKVRLKGSQKGSITLLYEQIRE